MQKLNLSRALFSLSAASIALLPLSGALEAKPKNNGVPPSYAPAWGYRNQDPNFRNDDNDDEYDEYDHRSRNRGDYRNNDRNGSQRRGQGVERGSFGDLVTLEGVVTSRRDFNEFKVRAGGRTFNVRSNTNTTVNTGDLVVLRGSFDNNNFTAQSVRVLRDGNRRNDDDRYGNDYRPGIDRRVDFPGTVTRILSSREIEVRGDNGQVYRVETRRNVNSFGVGTRVRVAGDGNGTRIRNASVFADGNSGTMSNGGGVGDIFGGGIFNGGNTNTNIGRSVDFPATIIRLGDNEGVVRGDNGRQYTVRGREVDGFRVGERVRVRGVSRAGFIDLRDLDRI